jgi:hypothetical protein
VCLTQTVCLVNPGPIETMLLLSVTTGSKRSQRSPLAPLLRERRALLRFLRLRERGVLARSGRKGTVDAFDRAV